MYFIIFEEYISDPVLHLNELCKFLGISKMDESYLNNIADIKKNKTTIPKFLQLDKLISKVIGRNNIVYSILRKFNSKTPDIKPTDNEIERLKNIYRDSFCELEEFLERKIDVWNLT